MRNSAVPQLGETKDGYVLTESGWIPTKPPKKNRTFLKVFLALCAFGLISVIGLLALVDAGANGVAQSIDQNANKAGGDSNPMMITEGKAFEVDGFNYSKGWSLGKDVLGDLTIKGLKVTNNRDNNDSALVEVKVWKGTEVLALADCTTEPIGVGTTVTPSCVSTDALPKNFTEITINDTF